MQSCLSALSHSNIIQAAGIYRGLASRFNCSDGSARRQEVRDYMFTLPLCDTNQMTQQSKDVTQYTEPYD